MILQNLLFRLSTKNQRQQLKIFHKLDFMPKQFLWFLWVLIGLEIYVNFVARNYQCFNELKAFFKLSFQNNVKKRHIYIIKIFILRFTSVNFKPNHENCAQ